jgi:hypothetical protein
VGDQCGSQLHQSTDVIINGNEMRPSEKMLIINPMKKVKTLFRLFVVLPAFLLIILAWTADNEPLEQLKSDYAALRAAEEDYRAQREFNGLDGPEAADYAAYVARLQRRVFEDCQLVIRSGSSFPEDIPCPVIIPPVTQSADISTQDELTPEEQIAALDQQLNAGMGEYDEKLLREQERIKAATPNENLDSGGAGGAGSGDGGEGADGAGADGDGSASGNQQGDSQNDGQNAGGDREGARSGGQNAGGPVDSSSGSGDDGSDQDQAADIPDGSDDGVVARQLREAAEKETDPELKAKLWEEYRRYKQGTN